MAPFPLVRSAGLLILAIATTCAAAAGAAPDVTFLFPPGLQRGQTRVVKLNGKPGTPPVHVWCDRPDVTIEPGEDGEELSVTAAENAPPGLCWVRVYNEEGASPLLPLMIGVLPEVTEEEFEELKSAGSDAAVSPPLTISGVLSRSGQVDSYTVSLEAGQTLVASVDSQRALGTPADVVLQLVSESGFVIDQNDDHHGFDPLLAHTAQRTSPCTVRVFAFPADPNSSIRFAGGDSYVYRLTLTTGPFLSYLLPLSIPEEDGDARTVPKCIGWNLSGETAPPELLDASQPIPVSTSLPGSFLPRRIRRSPHVSVLEAEDTTATAPQEVPVPVSVTGRIDAPGGVDAYAFEAAKGRKLRIAVAARAFDSLLDPVLRVVDASGKTLREEDDVSRGDRDAALSLTMPEGGPFRAEITDRYGHGGTEYVYELTIADDRPRFELTVDEDRYVLPSGKPLEITVDVEREGDFEEPVTIGLSGAPEGVTAGEVTSESKGRSAREVKLKLTSTAEEGWNGPVEIVGTSADGAAVRATAPAPSAGLRTTAVWLTVTPPKASKDTKQ